MSSDNKNESRKYGRKAAACWFPARKILSVKISGKDRDLAVGTRSLSSVGKALIADHNSTDKSSDEGEYIYVPIFGICGPYKVVSAHLADVFCKGSDSNKDILRAGFDALFENEGFASKYILKYEDIKTDMVTNPKSKETKEKFIEFIKSDIYINPFLYVNGDDLLSETVMKDSGDHFHDFMVGIAESLLKIGTTLASDNNIDMSRGKKSARKKLRSAFAKNKQFPVIKGSRQKIACADYFISYEQFENTDVLTLNPVSLFEAALSKKLVTVAFSGLPKAKKDAVMEYVNSKNLHTKLLPVLPLKFHKGTNENEGEKKASTGTKTKKSDPRRNLVSRFTGYSKLATGSSTTSYDLLRSGKKVLLASKYDTTNHTGLILADYKSSQYRAFKGDVKVPSTLSDNAEDYDNDLLTKLMVKFLYFDVPTKKTQASAKREKPEVILEDIFSFIGLDDREISKVMANRASPPASGKGKHFDGGDEDDEEETQEEEEQQAEEEDAGSEEEED